MPRDAATAWGGGRRCKGRGSRVSFTALSEALGRRSSSAGVAGHRRLNGCCSIANLPDLPFVDASRTARTQPPALATRTQPPPIHGEGGGVGLGWVVARTGGGFPRPVCPSLTSTTGPYPGCLGGGVCQGIIGEGENSATSRNAEARWHFLVGSGWSVQKTPLKIASPSGCRTDSRSIYRWVGGAQRSSRKNELENEKSVPKPSAKWCSQLLQRVAAQRVPIACRRCCDSGAARRRGVGALFPVESWTIDTQTW